MSNIIIDETWKLKHVAALAELDRPDRREQIQESARLVHDARETIRIEQTYADLAELSDEEIDRRIQAAVKEVKNLK